MSVARWRCPYLSTSVRVSSTADIFYYISCCDTPHGTGAWPVRHLSAMRPQKAGKWRLFLKSPVYYSKKKEKKASSKLGPRRQNKKNSFFHSFWKPPLRKEESVKKTITTTTTLCYKTKISQLVCVLVYLSLEANKKKKSPWETQRH